MQLPKYSIGLGDRFAHQGPAQLDACILARDRGIAVAPVWNKSHREHQLIGSVPRDVRAEADAAVEARGWQGAYFVDADHVNADTLGAYFDAADYFTLDVAERIGVDPGADAVERFVARHGSLAGRLAIPGLDRPLDLSPAMLAGVARKYLAAVEEAERLFRRIQAAKNDAAVLEISFDETDQPQSPAELFVILAEIAWRSIPIQTIAPKFSGRFNKGVDYVGDAGRFAEEFAADVAIVQHAAERFGLPRNLKLSVHSGSDKFSLYPAMRKAIQRFDAGLHLKTAGTTWLAEAIGLAQASEEGLRFLRTILLAALERREELVAPYASVVDINPAALPSADEIAGWDSVRVAVALRHDPAEKRYNSSLRQLLHVAYPLAAEQKERYVSLLGRHASVIGRSVTENLFERHIRPIFCG